MAIIRKNEVTPERPIIMVLYGVPGSGKTSVATTAENPLLIDTDRGYDRAVQRCEATLVANNWHDIDNEREAMKGFKTIVVDTAKAMLDDFLSAFAIEKNFKLKTNTLKRFGQMGEDFKDFVNFLRSNGSDIIFICHDKEVQDGDFIKHSPDCTGQSKDLLVRIADQVGYISIINNKRTITFSSTDNYVLKNVGEIPTQVIPNYGTKEFDTFMAGIIKQVKTALLHKSEAQVKAQEQLRKCRETLASVKTDDDISGVLNLAKELPMLFKRPFMEEMKKTLDYNEEKKEFHIKDNNDEQAAG